MGDLRPPHWTGVWGGGARPLPHQDSMAPSALGSGGAPGPLPRQDSVTLEDPPEDPTRADGWSQGLPGLPTPSLRSLLEPLAPLLRYPHPDPLALHTKGWGWGDCPRKGDQLVFPNFREE